LVVLLYLLTYSAFMAFWFSFTCSQSSFHLLHGGYHLKFLLWAVIHIFLHKSSSKVVYAAHYFLAFVFLSSLWASKSKAYTLRCRNALLNNY
jgi:hypothetical protein